MSFVLLIAHCPLTIDHCSWYSLGMIKAAILDLGQVVIACKTEKIPLHWARSCGGDPALIRDILEADTEFHRLERGEMTMDDYYRHIMGLVGREMSFDDFLAGWNCFYDGLMPKALEMLTGLREQGRLIALTNTNAGHAGVWKKLFADTLEIFERVFCSHEIAARKPEASSYQIALDYLGLENENVVFVDDRTDNVAAAQAMGMKGVIATDTASTMEKLRNLGAL